MVQRVAIYCRVSTDDQSCDRQESELTAFCQRAGYEVLGVFKEVASGAKNDRVERRKVLALAQARQISAVVVSELSRWGRSTQDLVSTLNDLQAWGVSLVAMQGLTFDLSTATGKLLATLLAALAEFERDLIRERVKSGLAAAKARGKTLGRRVGQKVVADKIRDTVIRLVEEGYSYRDIALRLRCSKTTVNSIMRDHREDNFVLHAEDGLDLDELGRELTRVVTRIP